MTGSCMGLLEGPKKKRIMTKAAWCRQEAEKQRAAAEIEAERRATDEYRVRGSSKHAKMLTFICSFRRRGTKHAQYVCACMLGHVDIAHMLAA